MSAQTSSNQEASPAEISLLHGLTELLIVTVLIILSSLFLPDAFIQFMIKQFGSGGSWLMTLIVYLALRIWLMTSFQLQSGRKVK